MCRNQGNVWVYNHGWHATFGTKIPDDLVAVDDGKIFMATLRFAHPQGHTLQKPDGFAWHARIRHKAAVQTDDFVDCFFGNQDIGLFCQGFDFVQNDLFHLLPTWFVEAQHLKIGRIAGSVQFNAGKLLFGTFTDHPNLSLTEVGGQKLRHTRFIALVLAHLKQIHQVAQI